MDKIMIIHYLEIVNGIILLRMTPV